MNWEEIIKGLENGSLRAAFPSENGNGIGNGIGNDGNSTSEWTVNKEVKLGILAAFKAGINTQFGEYFVDKHNIFPRKFTPENGVRLVPHGSSVRSGAYIAPGVIIMPPSYINIGAYVDSGTMVDSHVLVGSCAQIGKNVHLSAGVQIGGVLEPIGESPVIIEDDAFIGAGSIIVEGVRVGKRAVIAPGVVLSKSISVFNVIENCLMPKGAAIPANAVIVPGSRPYGSDRSQGYQIQCPLLIKYRDEKSNASLTLEEALR